MWAPTAAMALILLVVFAFVAFLASGCAARAGVGAGGYAEQRARPRVGSGKKEVSSDLSGAQKTPFLLSKKEYPYYLR